MVSSSPNLRHSTGCALPDLDPSEVAVLGSLNFHRVIIFIGTICAALAILIRSGLIVHHAARCYRVQEQKYLMRVTWVIPAFAITYTLCCWYYPAFQYIQTIPEIVEAFSFVSLFQMFVVLATGTTDRHEQEAYFQKQPRFQNKKIWQVFMPSRNQKPSRLRHDKGSLRWFRVVNLCLYQFPVVKACWTPIDVLVTYILCPTARVGELFHAVNGVVNAVTTTLALFAMIQFYSRLRDDLKPRHAFRKAFIFKKMIGVVLTQSVIMSFLISAKAIHPTATMSFGDYTIGIPTFMAQCEMFLFAIAFCFAYNVREFERLHQREDQEIAASAGQGMATSRTGKTSLPRAFWAMLNISDFIGGLFGVLRNIPRIMKKQYALEGVPLMKAESVHSDDESSMPLAPPTAPQYTSYPPQTNFGAQHVSHPSQDAYSDRYEPYESRYDDGQTAYGRAPVEPHAFVETGYHPENRF